MANSVELPLQLTRLAHFLRVVDDGGFSSAARRLATTKSTISRNIADLEADLGVKLLTRTTRKLSLTDEGRDLYERSAPLLAGMDAALRAAAGRRAAPQGTLRVFATTALGRFHLSPLLPDFLRRFPEVRLDLVFAERPVDLVSEGIDVAFVSRPVERSPALVRRYGPTPRILCATPAYLRKHGEPRAPEELQAHACLAWSELPGAPIVWRLLGPAGATQLKIVPRVRANSSEELMALLLAGVGIGYPPLFALAEHLAARRLRRVLPGFAAEPVDLCLLCPPGRRADPKVDVFLRHLTERLDRLHPVAT